MKVLRASEFGGHWRDIQSASGSTRKAELVETHNIALSIERLQGAPTIRAGSGRSITP
jgi:hypothetical protein